MPVTAKICGLSTPETLDAAIRHGARYVGFMFVDISPRNVSFAEAAALSARVPAHINRIGIFVDPGDEVLEQAIASGNLNAVQLHKTSHARTAHIRKHFGRETWAAVAVKTRADLDAVGGFADAADRILYDAKTPAGAALPGGMGVRFDWSLLQGFSHPFPWALSGGLDATNVGEAVRQTGATLVDVSSGVESAPGVKDVDKIAAFLKALRA